MSKILFHPQLKAIDAVRIAKEQGCRLVWRQRLRKAQYHADAAHVAILNGQHEKALQHIRNGQQQIAEVMPCAS